MFIFIYADVQMVSVINAAETYENISKGMKNSLQQINEFIEKPSIEIDDDVFHLEFFLCSDYKVQ